MAHTDTEISLHTDGIKKEYSSTVAVKLQCTARPADSLSTLFLISFCVRLFALKIFARHSASRHNSHVVVINLNYLGLKKPQLLFDFKNKP